jgi:hypothetical protein
LAPAFHFTEITDPDTGRPIMVRQNLDPIGQLYVAGRITKIQRDASAAYQADIEAHQLRAPSRGPEDVAGWRGHRPGYGHRKRQKHLERVAKDLKPDQTAAIQNAMAGYKVDIRTLTTALDQLAEIYGLSTKTRH